jgi:hypothetical protein
MALVDQRLNIAKVLSPFEVVHCPDAETGVDGVMNQGGPHCQTNTCSVIRSWESCDEHVWTLARQLCLVTEQQQIASMATEFPESLRGSACHDVPPCTDHCLYMNNITPTAIVSYSKLKYGNEKREFLIGSLPAETYSFEKKAKVVDVQLQQQSAPLTPPNNTTWHSLPQSIASLPPANSSLLTTLLLQQQALQQQQQQQQQLLQQQQQQLLTLQSYQRHGLAQGTPLTSVAPPSLHLQSGLPDTSVHSAAAAAADAVDSLAAICYSQFAVASAERFPSSC